MSQTFQFRPTAIQPFQFQPTLDGAVYTCFVLWGLFGQRWYVWLYALNGTRVLTIPLIGSPNDSDISMTAGYFASKLIFRESSNRFEVT